MVKFLSKRVIVLAVILSVIAFFVDEWRIEVSLGVLMGSLFSIYKTRWTSIVLQSVLSQAQGASIKYALMSIAIQLLMLLALLVAVLVDVRFFIGMFIGMLLMVITICINSITEKLGMTQNEWGDL